MWPSVSNLQPTAYSLKPQLFAALEPLGWSGTLSAAVLLWLFVLGSAVGSFINVLVYRWPLGLSIVRPGSHCPACQHPIRWYDNVPVLGWLWLLGRCRDCRAKISLRYPLVELLFGLLFVGLAWLEVSMEGVNLPIRAQESDLWESPSLWTQYAYHLTLLCVLVVAALLEFDGHAAPWPFWICVLIAGLAAPLFWPHLRPVAYESRMTDWLVEPAWKIGAVEGALGLGAGVVLGLLALPGTGFGPSRFAGKWTAILELSAIGSFLGWQRVAEVAVVAMGMLLVVSFLPKDRAAARHIGWSVCLAGTTLFGIAGWFAPTPLGGRLDPQDSMKMFAVTAALVLGMALAVLALQKFQQRLAEPKASR